MKIYTGFFYLVCVILFLSVITEIQANGAAEVKMQTIKGKTTDFPFLIHMITLVFLFLIVCLSLDKSAGLTFFSHLNVFLAGTMFSPSRLNSSGVTVEFALSRLLQEKKL